MKDFDGTEINDSRFRSRSLNTLIETTGPFEDVPARPRSFIEVCEEPTIGKTEQESTNAVEIPPTPKSFTDIENEGQSTHVLATRQRSFTDGCEEIDGEIFKQANLDSEKNEIKDSVSENAGGMNYISSKKPS